MSERLAVRTLEITGARAVKDERLAAFRIEFDDRNYGNSARSC